MGHEHKKDILSPRVARATLALSAGLMGVLVLVLTLCACIGATASCGSQRITGVAVSDHSDSVVIKVSAVNPIVMNVLRHNDRYVAFDVRGMTTVERSSKVIRSGGITSVVYGMYSSTPPTVRIVANCTNGRRPYQIAYADNKRTAVIKLTKAVSMATAEFKAGARIAKPKELPAFASALTLSALPMLAGQPVLVASNKPVEIPIIQMADEDQAKPTSNRVSLDFVGSDIHDVIKALAMQTGANIIAGTDVKGEVTVSLKNVTVDEALRLVTNLSGYKFALVNGTYVIGSTANIQSINGGSVVSGQDDSLAAVVMIKYSDPNSLISLLGKQYPNVKTVVNRGFLSGSASSNGGGGGGNGSSGGGSKSSVHGNVMLVLEGPIDQVKAAKGVAESIELCLSESAKDVVIDTYEVRFANAREMKKAVMTYVPGVEVTEGPGGYDFNAIAAKTNTSLAVPFSTTGGTGAFGQSQTSAATSTSTTSAAGGQSEDPKDDPKSTPAMMNILVIQGSKEDVAKAKAFLLKMDIPENQIMLEAKIVDLNDNATKDLGVDWSWGSLDSNGKLTDTISVGETDFGRNVPSSVGNITLGRFHRSPLEISATISAMISQGKGKVIASPNVCVLDGKQANIFIGDEITYISSQSQTPTGPVFTTGIVDAGVGLMALCRISSDGYITMALRPEVSAITGFLSTPGGGQLPQVSTRKLASTIRVKNGETVVIGGLIKDDEVKNMSKLPILSDLPLVGSLFRSRHNTKNHSEVVMFITPRLLSNGQ